MGVPLRVHVALPLLLALAGGYSIVVTGSPLRGVGLWLALLCAVVVREVARAIAAAYLGMPLRALLLLPIGGVMALAPKQGGLPRSSTRSITAVGSVTNFLVAALLLGLSYGIDPHVRLLDQPWISTGHILRSAIWLQLAVGLVNLLPTTALPGPRAMQSQAKPASSPVRRAGVAAYRGSFSLWNALALALMLSGLFFGLLWPVLLGFTVLLTSFVHRATGPGAMEGLALNVRDVMLTEFRPLSASSTLRDALRQSTHTVQELFPVLRGERLVGWISRGTLLTRLRAEGDGFLQSAMAKSFQSAEPGEKLGEALRRASALGAAEFIPVVENGAMVGMLTPTSLERAFRQLRVTRVPAESE
jgi:CBS domain-containing protein